MMKTIQSSSPRVAVVGLGGDHHHDADIGLQVVERLRGRLPSSVAVLQKSQEGPDLERALALYEIVILIDSSCIGGRPGTVGRLEAYERPGYGDWFPYYAMHASGMRGGLEETRDFNGGPGRVLLFCVEGKDYSPGDGLSSELEAVVDEVAERIVTELSSTATLG